MLLRLLRKTDYWKKSSLAQRVAVLTHSFVIVVLLPTLILSYSALRTLLLEKIAVELQAVADDSLLRLEAQLDALIDQVDNTAAQSVFSNALADSAEQSRYIRPILRDICAASPDIKTLILTDFAGKSLVEGCGQHAGGNRWIVEDAQVAIEQGGAQLRVRDFASTPHLDIAAPIVYLPTGSLEGALWARIDLTTVFDKVRAYGRPDYHIQLRPLVGPSLATAPAPQIDDRLQARVPVSIGEDVTLPLVIEVSITHDIAYRPLRLLLLQWGLITLVIIAFVAWQSRRIANEIASPLAELELTAQRVTAGDFDTVPSVQLREGERDSFRLLSASVYRMIHTLRETQRQLSDAVEVRTQQMARADADRHLKEQALASSASGVVIIEHAADENALVRYVNAAFLRISGLSEPKCIDAQWKRMLSSCEAVGSEADGLHKGVDAPACSAAPMHAVWTKDDGSSVHLELSISPVLDKDGLSARHSVVIVNDVSAEHEARLAIAVREQAMQAASNGVVITDLQQPDNPIIYVNPAFEHITQYRAEEVIGHNCRLLNPGARDSAQRRQLRKAIAAREACTVVLSNRRKDGSEFWNQLAISPVISPLSGEATHYVGIQTDITERRKSEDSMFEWLSRLEAIFTLNPDPLICFDEAGKLSYANPAAERIFGATMGALISLTGEALERHLRAQCDPAYPFPGLPSTTSPPVADDVAGVDAHHGCVLHLQHPKPLILHQTYRYCGAAGTSLVIYYRDVTREVELDRMKSEFLSTAAHELRTPMASIVGFSELLMMRRYDEDKTRELLATINRQANRLTALLTDLLDLARIEARRGESMSFESLDLRTAIDDTLAAFLLPDSRHRLVVELPEFGIEIRADRAKFQQALLNLLSNACKFSPAGGDVELRVLHSHPEQKPLIGISVRDHGIGMSEEAQRHAFQRFYRSDRSGHIPGTGLGLSLVSEILAIHGGSVTLESEPDKGTCVTLWFPLEPPDTPTAAPLPPSSADTLQK